MVPVLMHQHLLVGLERGRDAVDRVVLMHWRYHPDMKHICSSPRSRLRASCLLERKQREDHPTPELQFVQLSGPAEQNYPPGDIEVQYGMRIANRSSEPITLRRIEIRSVGLGGPYRLRPRHLLLRTSDPAGDSSRT